MKQIKSSEIAAMMDISLLHPKFSRPDIDAMIDIAIQYKMASVCAKGYDVKYCADRLKGTSVKVGGSAGFPHGNGTTESKVLEARQNILDGAEELDTVLPIGLVRSGLWQYALNEMKEMTKICHDNGVILKVIFENAYLTQEEIIRCCEISNEAGIDFAKTSTGYAPTGATLEDCILMRKHCAPNVQIKAAGGIRTLEDFMAYYEAGVTRQGTSTAVAIVNDAIARGW